MNGDDGGDKKEEEERSRDDDDESGSTGFEARRETADEGGCICKVDAWKKEEKKLFKTTSFICVTVFVIIIISS